MVTDAVMVTGTATVAIGIVKLEIFAVVGTAVVATTVVDTAVDTTTTRDIPVIVDTAGGSLAC